MKKIIFAVMLIMVTIVAGNGVDASAHTEMYRNYSLADNRQYENNELTTVSIVVYDYDGYRNQLDLNVYDDEETKWTAQFNFGYDYGIYYAQLVKSGKVDDHVMYCIMLYDDIPIGVVRCTATELYKELINSSWHAEKIEK